MTAPTVVDETTTAPPLTVPTKKSRRWIYLAVFAVIAVLIFGGLIALVASSAFNKVSGATSEPLDPGNPGQSGTRALAQVLATHGVDVKIVRNQRQLLAAARPDSNTTVVMTGSENLNDYTAGAFRDRVANAKRVVYLNPRYSAMSILKLPVTFASSASELTTREAGCTVTGISPTDVMTVSQGYRADGLVTNCFRIQDGAGIIDASDLLVLPKDSARPETVVASAAGFMNRTIGSVDNAGVAVRTLGSTHRLIWYVPSNKDTPPSQTVSGPSDIPRAIGPLIALAFVGLLAAMLWRGRRFGRLVSEPLPAVVKAIETTQARGRLYHRAADVPRAAAQLRTHTIANLSRSLGLPARTDVALVIDAATTATGIDHGALSAALAGPLPTTDEALVKFANDLSRIEERVHRRYE